MNDWRGDRLRAALASSPPGAAQGVVKEGISIELVLALRYLAAAPTIFRGNNVLEATIAGGNAASGIYSYSITVVVIAWLNSLAITMFPTKIAEPDRAIELSEVRRDTSPRRLAIGTGGRS